MRISTKGRYGLRVMTELASRFGNGPAMVDEIAQNQDISAKYIHVLMPGLISAGLARSARGRKGGYEIARDPASVTAWDVALALERDMEPVNCAADSSRCKRAPLCPERDVWGAVAAAVRDALRGFTLADLARMKREKESSLSRSLYMI